jgi:lysine 2,3-aminomutase
MQAIPRAAEADVRAEELRDPLGEDTHKPTPSVFHKYPDRVLFLVVDRCGI